MNSSVRAQEIPRVDRSLAAYVRRPSARLFDADPQRREVPRFRRPVQRHFRAPFRAQHVLPESAERPPAARRIRHASNLLLRDLILAGTGPGGEHHRLAQLSDVRHMNPLAVPISASPSIGPPAARESRRARHPRNDLSIPLDGQQRSKRRNPPRKFLRAVDRIDNQSRLPRPRYLVVVAAHLFAQHIQRDPARRHLRSRHFFHGAIRLRNSRSITLSFDPHSVCAKILHRDGIRFLRNVFQQRPILRSIAHHLPCAVSVIHSLTKCARAPKHTKLPQCLHKPTPERCSTAFSKPAAPLSITAKRFCRKLRSSSARKQPLRCATSPPRSPAMASTSLPN